jgi:hypothetical protein
MFGRTLYRPAYRGPSISWRPRLVSGFPVLDYRMRAGGSPKTKRKRSQSPAEAKHEVENMFRTCEWRWREVWNAVSDLHLCLNMGGDHLAAWIAREITQSRIGPSLGDYFAKIMGCLMDLAQHPRVVGDPNLWWALDEARKDVKEGMTESEKFQLDAIRRLERNVLDAHYRAAMKGTREQTLAVLKIQNDYESTLFFYLLKRVLEPLCQSHPGFSLKLQDRLIDACNVTPEIAAKNKHVPNIQKHVNIRHRFQLNMGEIADSPE